MSDSKSNKTQAKQQPITTIRNGAVAASIWRRQTATGFEYLEFSLSRSWKMKANDKEGYSSNFFARNEEALCDVIARACQFIREHQNPAADSGSSNEVALADVA